MTDPDPMIPLTDAFLDRIVDGELPPGELRRAIERLESEPDGWKRCALAFLEAQCWRESFCAEQCRAPALADGDAHSISQSIRRSNRPSLGWRRVAMAAGIAAISFALGWRVRPDQPPPRESTAASVPATANPSPPSAGAESDQLADVPDIAAGMSRDERPSSDPTPPVLTVGRLRVGGSDSAATVPIVAGPGIDEEWVRNQPPPITEHQQAILEQQGFQVDRRRRLITATLADGRRVTVPIDQVQLRYTGIEPL
jgi:hypothetical protein